MYNEDELKSFLKSIMKDGIRIRQRRSEKFDKPTLKTITLSLDGGILGVTGCLKSQPDRKIQTLIFNKSINRYGIRTWSLRKAKLWLKHHKQSIRKIVNPERVINKVLISGMIKSVEKLLIDKLPKVIEKALEDN